MSSQPLFQYTLSVSVFPPVSTSSMLLFDNHLLTVYFTSSRTLSPAVFSGTRVLISPLILSTIFPSLPHLYSGRVHVSSLNYLAPTLNTLAFPLVLTHGRIQTLVNLICLLTLALYWNSWCGWCKNIQCCQHLKPVTTNLKQAFGGPWHVCDVFLGMLPFCSLRRFYTFCLLRLSTFTLTFVWSLSFP